ncbi:MAG: hypothetical protein JSU65_08655 [Candidatus Zixiibacteriota bacterium]|nr:MAG: hypothetical protein JSU65_08655 [candidate division Zixibacteria bacterium]
MGTENQGQMCLTSAGLAGAKVAKAASDRRFQTRDRLGAMLKLSSGDIGSGRFRIMLYRFLTEQVPAVSACVWTWVRLSAAVGEYRVASDGKQSEDVRAQARLNDLWQRGYTNLLGNRVGLASLMPDLFASLFRDGLFGGFVTVDRDGSGVDQFLPVDPIDIQVDEQGQTRRLMLDLDHARINLDRPDFYFIPFSAGISRPTGRSMLQPIPFVSYIEQQLVDDMRRTSHNSGYHRVHVRITPPERMAGESDSAYTDRINSYFDSTVRMIQTCELDDNPVTWDNVAIDCIGPDKSREVSNSWFVNHRAMVEEICAGTNLAPYLLGYSYGATTTWSNFKFDVVMRQVRSIQSEVAHFLEWLGNIDLALAGLDRKCRFVFDNSFAYQAVDRLALRSGEIENLLKLYQAGLIDKDTASVKVRELV